MTTFHQWRLKAMICLGIVAASVVMTLGLVKIFAPPVWAPLGEYPVQEVKNRAGGSDVPAVYLDDDVYSTGSKCNRTDAAVSIIGSQSWVSANPPGTAIPIVKEARNVRLPGCSTRDYVNPIPPEVKARTVALYDAGFQDVTWYVTGSDTPVRDGETGQRVVWQTQSFKILEPTTTTTVDTTTTTLPPTTTTSPAPPTTTLDLLASTTTAESTTTTQTTTTEPPPTTTTTELPPETTTTTELPVDTTDTIAAPTITETKGLTP
jgi:hypothetical protein